MTGVLSYWSRFRFWQALAAAVALEELLLMLGTGLESEAYSELGALINAGLLTAMVAATYALLAPRFLPILQARRALIVNTATISVATFTIQCASHLISHHFGRDVHPMLIATLDAVFMSVTVPAFAAWLHHMELKAQDAGASGAEQKSRVISAIAGALVVSLMASGTPALLSISNALLDAPSGVSEKVVEMAGRQRMLAQQIARMVAENQPRAEIVRVLREDWEHQIRLEDAVDEFVEATKPGPDWVNRLPRNPDMIAARQAYLRTVGEYLREDGAAKAGAALRLRSEIDTFMDRTDDALADFAEFTGDGDGAFEHNLFVIVILMAPGLLVLATLVPVLQFMVGQQARLSSALDQAQSSLNFMQSVRGALDRHAIVGITDSKGRITHVNGRFCEISGYSEEELIGQDHKMLNSGWHPKFFFVDMWRQIGSGKPFRAEIRNRKKTGEFYWVDTTIVPVIGANGRPESFISIRYDITQAKESERVLRKANEDLEARVERRTADLLAAKTAAEAANAAKSQFLATMSHELRTPLSSIIAYTELIQEVADGEGREKDSADADIILAAANHLMGMITEMLDLSKLEAGEMSFRYDWQDCALMINEAAMATRPVVERNGNRFTVSLADGLPRIRTDAGRFRQCLLNLLSNAAKFTENGEISLEARVESWAEYDVIRVDVRDTGIGISREAMAKLFRPFRQADASIERKYGGTGLGLAITRQMAERMGGAVNATSTAGEGSVFTLWLPVDSALATDPEALTSEEAA